MHIKHLYICKQQQQQQQHICNLELEFCKKRLISRGGHKVCFYIYIIVTHVQIHV